MVEGKEKKENKLPDLEKKEITDLSDLATMDESAVIQQMMKLAKLQEPVFKDMISAAEDTKQHKKIQEKMRLATKKRDEQFDQDRKQQLSLMKENNQICKETLEIFREIRDEFKRLNNGKLDD